ncbi:MAG: hypothetical protein H0V09_04125, partial [Gemmatimonadetes bacterium]|nr:hypothetical protein [Gemmatimonadota bacterium]
MPAFRSVGIVANPQRPDVPEAVTSAIAWLQRRGVRVSADPDSHRRLQLAVPPFAWDSLASEVDLLLTFGG